MFKEKLKVYSSAQTICNGVIKNEWEEEEERRIETRDSSLGFCVEYGKTELKTFKAGRENIFGGICRTKPTERNEKLPRATNGIHGFCIGWYPGKNPPNVGSPLRTGPI